MRPFRRFAPLLSSVLILAMALVLAGACAAPEGEPGPNATSSTAFTITDSLGKTFSFDQPVDSIISLAPSNTEIVFAVGAGDKLIGRTDYDNYPPEAASIESVGSFWSPNKETVVIMNPDAILATGAHDQSGDTAWLEEKGLEVITLDPLTLSDVQEIITLVGTLTGNVAEAGELVADMQSRIDFVADRTAGLSDSQKPKVLHVTWHDPLWTAGKDTFIDALIDIAGGVNIFDDITGDAQASLDSAVIRDPDVITVFTGHGAARDESYEWAVADDSPFKNTAAYLDGRIHLIDADIASRGGPRLVEALEIYALFLHPEIFD